MSSVVSPASADEALEMLTAAMGYLAVADATAMTAEEQARCLRVLERATSVGTAARTSVLGAFGSGQGYSADADYSPRAWLIHKTGVTKGAAVSYTAWCDGPKTTRGSWRRWLPGTCPSPWPGSCASGPTGSRRTSGTSRTTNSSRLPWPA